MYFLAAIYSLMIVLAALIGGWVPMLVRLTHTRMQLFLSFVAGVILGIGLLHLLPHGYLQLENIDQTAMWLLGGFLVMFFLERFFHFHHHDAPVDETPKDIAKEAHEHCDHQPSKGEHHHHADATSMTRLSWSGALMGLTLHSLIDGLALGAAIFADKSEHRAAQLAGFGTFLAVWLHKPFDSLTISTLMVAGGWSRGWQHAVNVGYAAIAPLGTLAFFLGLEQVGRGHSMFVGAALCFASGAFLCISTSDLLPEVQFHKHDRVKLSLALLLGVALAAAIVLLETTGHQHHLPR
ncbi:MAG: ZIP family metal transporter [Pirellulales bacterium]|nr:ZIP family metal transporter [Pirellulales bacterium]